MGCNFVKDKGSVYVNPLGGITLQTLTAEFYKPQFAGNASLMTPTVALSDKCLTEYLRLWCGTIYRDCTPVPGNAVPHGPCRSVCVQTNIVCQDEFEKLGIVIDCDRIDPYSGYPLWLPISNPPFTCSLFESDIPLSFECPPRLHFISPDTDQATGLPCAVTCHDFEHAFNSNFDAIFLYQTVAW